MSQRIFPFCFVEGYAVTNAVFISYHWLFNVLVANKTQFLGFIICHLNHMVIFFFLTCNHDNRGLNFYEVV